MYRGAQIHEKRNGQRVYTGERYPDRYYFEIPAHVFPDIAARHELREGDKVIPIQIVEAHPTGGATKMVMAFSGSN